MNLSNELKKRGFIPPKYKLFDVVSYKEEKYVICAVHAPVAESECR